MADTKTDAAGYPEGAAPEGKAAKKPTQTAPYNPAIGPAPEATPKASARGNETIAAVKPPNKSPRKFLKWIVLVNDILGLWLQKQQNLDL